MAAVGAAGGAGWLARRAFLASARAEAGQPRRRPPRYWINIVPSGGIDAIWTTDPRRATEVNKGVDVPYPASRILGAPGIRLGPSLAPLAGRSGQFSVLKGILVGTANHYTGIEQTHRLRTKTTIRTPAVFDIIGSHRDSQALAHFTVSAPLRQVQTADFVGTAAEGMFGAGSDLLDALDSLEPEQLREISALIDRQIGSFKRRGDLSVKERKVLDVLGQSRSLFARAADAPRFSYRPWLAGAHAGQDGKDLLGRQLQRALWLIEHDLAAAVTVYERLFTWDSHGLNNELQTGPTELLAASLDQFMAALRTRSNRHGPLVDQTAFVLGSEIGRFPYLNFHAGKDHFPQVSMLFAGPPFRAGRSFGATGKELEALPVSLSRGRADPAGRRLALDDVGRTLLTMAGIDAATYGVAGDELRFLHAEPA